MNNNNNKKTLKLYAMGWEDKGTDIGNNNVVAKVINKRGRLFYLNLKGIYHKRVYPLTKDMRWLFYVGFVSRIWYLDTEEIDNLLLRLHDVHFEYNKKNILKFINDHLSCCFNDIEVIDVENPRAKTGSMASEISNCND